MVRHAKHIREWGGFVFGLVGAVLGTLGFLSAKQNTEVTNQIQADRLIAEAWDDLGGKPGTNEIVNYVTVPDKLEFASRKLNEAEMLAPRNAKVYSVKASLAIARRHYEDAALLCQKAIGLDPTAYQPHNQLGQLRIIQKRWSDAEAAYRGALRLRPRDAVLHSNLCFSLFKQNQLTAAATECETAIQLNDTFEQAYANLIAVRQAQGQSADAIAVKKQLDNLSLVAGPTTP